METPHIRFISVRDFLKVDVSFREEKKVYACKLTPFQQRFGRPHESAFEDEVIDELATFFENVRVANQGRFVLWPEFDAKITAIELYQHCHGNDPTAV